MKKLLLILSILVLSITNVDAKDNRLYFTEDGNELKYESSLINEKTFMKHLDMVPGSSFSDTLVIENGTLNDYTLYFKVVPRNQSEEAKKLLTEIDMKIHLDGKVIYNGKANGQDYSGKNVDLTNTVSLGKISSSEKKLMIVETSLADTYNAPSTGEYSYIDWTFYAENKDGTVTQIVEVPNTAKNKSSIYLAVAITTIAIGSSIVVFAVRKD